MSRPAPIDRRLADAGLPMLPRTAWLRVDTDVLAANLAALRTLAGPGVAIQVVVKADAYGHGAVPVSRALETAGADGFCVASFDEALELRAGGVRAPVVVLYAVPAAHVVEAARLNVALTVADDILLSRTLEAVAAARAAGALRRRVSLHLQVETGLGRDGVDVPTVAAAARAIRATPGAVLAGVWSHLAAPGDPASAGRQAAAFAEATGRLADARVRHGPRHLAASGAVLASSAPPYDAARIGIAIFGIAPDTVSGDSTARDRLALLRPAASLHALPARVADLPAGHGVGYGPSYVTGRRSRIATLPLGYADGWRRAFEGAPVLVRGLAVPTVGRVSMDSVTVDVTDVPGPPVTVDDEFVLLGRQGTAEAGIDELARRGATIAYEVVALLGRRLSRVYDSSSGTGTIRTLTGEVRR